MLLAKLAACRSTCLSRPTGAVIVKGRQVLATGYNGSVPGGVHCIDEGECYRRRLGARDAEKLAWCRASHAEANAVAQAARGGIAIDGGVIYTTLSPCFACAKLLASAGIAEVVYELEYASADRKRDRHWADALTEAGVKSRRIELRPAAIVQAAQFLEAGTSKRRIESK